MGARYFLGIRLPSPSVPSLQSGLENTGPAQLDGSRSKALRSQDQGIGGIIGRLRRKLRYPEDDMMAIMRSLA